MEDVDAVMRFVSDTATCDIQVAQFAVRHGCQAFPRLLQDPKARVGVTDTGAPIIRYVLDNLVDEALLLDIPYDKITCKILRLFFLLLRVLVTRSLSDGVLYDNVLRARYLREQDAISEASHYILHMHVLALRFICPRVRIWAERTIFRLLNETNAETLCSYMLEPSVPESNMLVVRPGSEALMHQFVLWYYCVNDASANTPFNTSVNLTLERLHNRELFDPFQTRIVANDNVIHMRGHSVRCAECRGTTLCYIGMHKNTLHLASVQAPGNDYWSVYIMDDATKGQSFCLVYVPGNVVDGQQQQGQHAFGSDVDTHTRETALYRAALSTPARPEQADLVFKCDVDIGVYRRISRTGLCAPETMTLRNAIITARDRSLHDGHGRPVSVVSSRFALPAATLDQSSMQWTWYDGTCQACHAEKPVSILSYRMSITTLSSSSSASTKQSDAMDTAMPSRL